MARILAPPFADDHSMICKNILRFSLGIRTRKGLCGALPPLPEGEADKAHQDLQEAGAGRGQADVEKGDRDLPASRFWATKADMDCIKAAGEGRWVPP